jgi:DNA-directed RNA polymerase alpha subunit
MYHAVTPQVHITQRSDRFYFTVETNGSLKPAEIVMTAFSQLKAKLAMLKNELEHLEH